MEESIIMAVRCPCCDTLLFESDNTNTKQKCPTCKKKLMITISNGQMYSMSLSKFQQIAKDAKACYKVNQLVLVNLDILDAYLETFRITEEDFYK